MQTVKQTESGPINKTLETDVERNVHELKRAGATFRQTGNGNAELAANNLATLLRRVSEVSTREIENLIGELSGLQKKLETDCGRIQDDVAEYVELNQGVMQLTANISNGVDSLPSTAGFGR